MSGTLTTVASFTLSVLGNGLWQAALLAGAAWLVLRAVRGANATTRHAVLVAALLGALVLPVVTTAAAFIGRSTAVHAPSSQDIASKGLAPSTGAPRTTKHATGASIPFSRSTTTQAGEPQRNAGSSVAPATASWRPHLALPPLLIVGLTVLWLVCALALAVRLAVSLLYLERLKRDALPLAVGYRTRLERWDAALKGTRDVRLCRSSDVTVPIAVGIFDAMILVPDHLLEELPAEDLDRVLLHELAHLRRGDDWVNALERLSEALLFFNPGVRWMVRQLDVEREVACDDWVLGRRNEALPYAQCLVKLVESVAWPHRPMVAPGVFVTRRSISIRIERLLAKQRDVRLRVSLAPLSALTALAVAVCLLGAYVAPSVASVAPQPAATALAARPATAPAPSLHAAPPRMQHAVASDPSHSSRPARSVALAAGARPAPSPIPSALSRPVTAAKPAVRADAPGPPGAFKVDVRTGVATKVHTDAIAHAAVANVVQVAASPDSVHVAANPIVVAPRPSAAMVAMNDGDYISDLASAGYTNLSVDRLVQLKSVGVDVAYIRDIQRLGIQHPSVEDLIRMRAIGLTVDYVRDMRRVFPDGTIEQMIQMRAVGVTPDFISSMRAAGVSIPNARMAQQLRAVGVTPDYVHEMTVAGFDHLDAEHITQLRAVGVTPEYVRDMQSAGYGHLSSEQLLQLKAVGVDRPFIAKVQAHGFNNLTIQQLIQLRTSGVLD